MPEPTYPTLAPLGDRALILRLGQQMHAEMFDAVQAAARYFDRFPLPAMIECVPGISSLTIFYDPLRATYSEVSAAVLDALPRIGHSEVAPPRTVEVPVCYGGPLGSDLEFVASHNHLSPDEVIRIHSSATYRVFMLGFSPGFPYLGGMPGQIATPRRPSPRLIVPAGSVGIAGNQTGIYSIATPGGWQLIGRTPLALFLPTEDPPTLLSPGDLVKFVPIDERQFAELSEHDS